MYSQKLPNVPAGPRESPGETFLTVQRSWFLSLLRFHQIRLPRQMDVLSAAGLSLMAVVPPSPDHPSAGPRAGVPSGQQGEAEWGCSRHVTFEMCCKDYQNEYAGLKIR